MMTTFSRATLQRQMSVAVCLGALVVGAPMVLAEAPAEVEATEAQAAESVEPLAKGVLGAVVEEVRFSPEVLSGKFEIESIAKACGQVKKGDVLLILSSESEDDIRKGLKKQIERAEISLEQQKQDAMLFTMSSKKKRVQLERRKEKAQDDLTHWSKTGRKAYVLSVQYELDSFVESLADMRQELEQLEEMYRTSKVSNVTQDFVLQRAKRKLDRNEKRLPTIKAEAEWKLGEGLVRAEETYRLSTEQSSKALEDFLRQTVRSELSWQQKLQDATESLESIRERYAKLDADVLRLKVRADFAGSLIPMDFEEGQKFASGAVAARIQSVEEGTASLSLPLAEVNRLRESKTEKVSLFVPCLDKNVEAEIVEIGLSGKSVKDGKGFVIPVQLSVPLNSGLMPGMSLEYLPQE